MIETVCSKISEADLLTRLSNGDSVKIIASHYKINNRTLEDKIERMRKCHDCFTTIQLVSKFIKGEIL